MPSTSQLRQSSYTTTTKSPIVKSTVASLHKKQKMTLTQTYYLAHTARAKLSKEASRADHDLRLLVGHANLLDGLMLDLAEAEREQESWFNQTVTKAIDEPKHIRFADQLPSVTEDYEEDSSDDESEASDDEEYIPAAPLRRVPSPPMIVTSEIEMDSDEEYDEDYEDNEGLQLTRTSSRTSSRTPPELLHESDSESDDDSMPPSPPPQPEIPLDAFSAKQRQAALSPSKPHPTSIAIPATSPEDAFYEEGYYLPQRQAVVAY